jgi:Regulator of chromosome condensation (RCC1) repeat
LLCACAGVPFSDVLACLAKYWPSVLNLKYPAAVYLRRGSLPRRTGLPCKVLALSTKPEVPCCCVLAQGFFVVQVAAGRFHSMALTSCGRLFTWGMNDYGQLGRPTSRGKKEPCMSGDTCHEAAPQVVEALEGEIPGRCCWVPNILS